MTMSITQEEITEKVIAWLDEFISDWGLDETLKGNTKFNEDLCFSSVDMLHFLAVIDMNMAKKYPFEKLLLTNRVYRNELTIAELATFIFENKDIEYQQPKAL
jgi:acyl carrier protein